MERRGSKYKANKIGPKIEPCGTPHVTEPRDEEHFPTTEKLLLVR